MENKRNKNRKDKPEITNKNSINFEYCRFKDIKKRIITKEDGRYQIYYNFNK